MATPKTRSDLERTLATPTSLDIPVGSAGQAAPEAEVAPAIATTTEGKEAYLHDQAGQLVAVPRELVGRYIAEQGFRPASPQSVEKAKVAAETSAAGEFLKEAGAAGVSTIGAGVRIPAMVADLAGVDGASDFVRETSPAGVRAAFAAGWAAIQGDGKAAADQWDDSKRRQVIAEELFPTARMLGRTTGEIGGSLLLGGPLGGWAGAAKTAAGVAARSALVSGAEGAASAMADEYRESYLENRAVDRERLISNGIIGGALSAAAGGVLGYGGKKLSDVFEARGAARAARARDVANTERAVAEAADELDRPAVELEQLMAESEARVAKAVAEAGPNPNAQRAAAEAAAEAEAKNLQAIAGAEYNPALWADAADPKKVSAMQGFIHRKTILEGAATELRQDGDEMLRGTSELTDILREAPLKKAHVAEKLAADGVDETAAIASAQRAQAAFGETLANTAAALESEGVGGSKMAKLFGSRLAKVNTIAAKKLAKVDNAADAFIIRDQFRREMYRTFQQVDGALQKGVADPYDRVAAEVLKPIVDAEYHRAANSLFDQSVWKSMGEFQRAANGQDGWVGLIDADKVGLRSFASVIKHDYGREVLGFDPDKLVSYLERIDQPTLRDAQIRNIIGKRAMMVRTIRDGLELTPAQRATADAVLESSEKALTALDNAEKIAIRLNRQAKLNEADTLLSQGGIVTRLLGGVTKLAQGEFRQAAAMQLGGSHMVAKQIQAMRIAAQGAESRSTRVLLKILEAVSGEGSPNASAIQKIEKRAVQGGLIDTGLEKLANRMRDQNYALAPLFKPQYGRPPSEQKEIHAARRDVLADLVANPAKMQQALEQVTARASEAHPMMGSQLAEETAARIQRLQAALPGVLLPSLLPSAPSGNREMVSEQQLREAEAMIEATVDPQSVFEDFQNGRLDYTKLKFAKEQYPEMFAQARAMALDVFRSLPADIRGNMATQLDFLLDFEGQLDPTLSSEFLQRRTERLQLQQEKTKQQNAAPRKAPNTGASAQTYTQRLAGV